MNLANDLRMVLYQLGRLAERVEATGREDEALRLREIAVEIRRLASDELCADPAD